MKLIARHEADYVRKKGTLENKLTSNSYVPKAFWIKDNKYFFFVQQNLVQVMSRMADKSECLHKAEDWIV